MSTPSKFNPQTAVYVILTEKGENHLTEETRHLGGIDQYRVRQRVFKMTIHDVFFFFSRKAESFSTFVLGREMHFEEPAIDAP